MKAFKDHPKIIEAYADFWFPTPEQKSCLECGKSFNMTVHNRKYCNSHCGKMFNKKKKSRITPEQHSALEIAVKKKFLRELKTVECSFCGNEYEQHKSSKAKYCCDFCRKAASKFREL